MPEIKNVFTSGRMNKDLDERLLSNNEYRDALNIQVASTDGSDIGVIQTLKGNVSKYTSTGKCIATVVDNENNKIYWFVKDAVSSEILEYDPSTETTVEVVNDSTNVVLEFTDDIITGIVLFEGFIAWTDNVNEPKIIDIEKAKVNPSSITLDDITIIRKKPLNAPTLNITTVEDGTIPNTAGGGNINFGSLGSEFTLDVSGLSVSVGDIVEFTHTNAQNELYLAQAEVINLNNPNTLKIVYRNHNAATDNITYPYVMRLFKSPLFEEKFVRFAYRWKYDNDQYSVMSPFSDTAFYPNVYKEYSIEDGYNNKMVNSITDLTLENIEVPEGVKEVEILYKESNNTNIYVYDRILNITTPTATATVDIEKENIYAVLESSQLLRAYDMVPKKAKALEVIGNRLVFGNYETGFDLSGYTPNLSISLIEVNNGDDLKSLKSGRSYEFGVVFEDDYGRQTPVVTAPNLVYKIPYGDEGKSKRFQVTLNNFPLNTNLTKYKIYVKESSQGYYNILIDKAFEDNSDNSAYWLSIPSYEINKFEEGDFLLLKKGANTNTPVNSELAKYKVLDVKTSKPDNVDSTDNFDGRFFIKINKDDRISTEFLSSLGLAGQSDFINEETFSDIVSPNSDYVLLGNIDWEQDPGSGYQRDNYYYKDGTIYVETDESASPSSYNFNFGTLITSDVTIGNVTLPVSEQWETFTEAGITDVVFYVKPVLAGRAPRFFVHFTSSLGLSVIPAIFETTVKDELLDIYYETNNTYDKEQTPSAKTLSWYNCFNFANGLESNRIKDDYNEVIMEKGVRVSSTISYDFNVIQAKNGIVWSGLFNARGGVNNLNQFNPGLKITKDLNPEYGSVQLLHTRNTDLIAICEDKVLKLLANKDALYNADGNVNITSTNNVIGQAIPFNGEFGTQNPESFSFYGYQAYFADKSRGAVLRLSVDGLTPISMANTVSYFRDKLKAHTGSIIGSYDIHTLQYILSFENNESISYSESSKGWTSRLSFIPEQGCHLNGKYYTFKNGNLWLHHAGSIGNFYGAQNTSSVKLIHNANPSSVKTFKTLNYEGTDGWYVPSISTNLDTGKVNEFINKEDKFYNYIKGNSETLDTSNFNAQGIGVISDIEGLGTLNISFNHDINVSLQVNSDTAGSYVGGDTIYFIDNNDDIQLLGKCIGILGNTITVGPIDSGDPIPVVGQYVLFSKSRIVNTGGLKGYYMEVDMQTKDNVKYRELFSVGTEAFISS